MKAGRRGRRTRSAPQAATLDDELAQQADLLGVVADGGLLIGELRRGLHVALACGLRLGEATGLLWSEVDLDSGELRVRHQLQAIKKQLVLQDLKAEASRRTLVLPDVCLQALREHRTHQLQERLKAGSRWVDTGLVFTTYRVCKEGKGVSMKVGAGLPRNVLRVLHGLLAVAELPRMRFHDLRHSSASLLAAEGVELVEVSKLLGHSEIRVTADLYGHLDEADGDEGGTPWTRCWRRAPVNRRPRSRAIALGRTVGRARDVAPDPIA